MNRRRFIAATAALALAPAGRAASARKRLGDVTVASVSDGGLVLPGAFFFEGLPQDEVGSILSAHDLTPDQLAPPCNLTLLQDGQRTILFDAGSGPGFMPSAGELIDSLAEIGVAPEDVTHVVFTHGHPDHLWGVLDDFDDLVFTEAEHVFGRTEWAYWRDPDTVNAIGEARASFAVGAARRLEAIEDRVRLIDGGEEILPGVMAHATPGHTPGHISYEIRSGTEALLIGGDAIGNHHIAFARPDWASGSDQDPELAAKTRTRMLDKLVADGIDLMGFHLPHGGMGRVERKDGAYRFVAADA